MTQNQDELDDIPSLVPERDELVTHRRQKRGTGTAQTVRTSGAAAAPEVYGSQTSGGVIFFLVLLTLGMVGTGGGAFYFYKQSEQTKQELISATNRITSLEATLNQMGETTKQSAMGLLEKVDFNFSEIDKLWAARNTLKTDVEKLTVAMTNVQKSATELETAVGNHGGQLNQINQQITAAQAKVEQIGKNFAGMENLGQQLTTLNADLNRVKTAMTKVESETEARLKATEQDIESINVYRLQVNQTLTTLQTNVNTLQQRVGQ